MNRLDTLIIKSIYDFEKTTTNQPLAIDLVSYLQPIFDIGFKTFFLHHTDLAVQGYIRNISKGQKEYITLTEKGKACAESIKNEIYYIYLKHKFGGEVDNLMNRWNDLNFQLEELNMRKENAQRELREIRQKSLIIKHEMDYINEELKKL